MRRRAFISSGLALGGGVLAGGLAAACAPTRSSTESTANLGAPETTTVRIVPVPCDPALWSAGDYLKEEGFTDVQLLPFSVGAVARGESEIGVGYTQWVVTNVDAGKPVVALAGLHSGCGEVWTRPGITSIRDLRGKTIAVGATDVVGDTWYGFWAAMLANVGIDVRRDVNFVTTTDTLDHFLRGESDAILALAGQVPALRASAKNPGKLLIRMQEDKPWTQYYCCQLVANRDWAQRNPIAAKRVTRAVLRANDRVAKDLVVAVRTGVEQGMYTGATFETILAVLKNGTYEWRELDAEASLRFFAVQLADLKLVKGGPQQLVAQAANFGYLAELRRQYPHAL